MTRFYTLFTTILLALALAACGPDQQQAGTTVPTTHPTQASKPTAPSTPTPLPTATPMPTPTRVSTATSTNAPAATGPAILGGTLNAFIAKYGQPNDHTQKSVGQYHFQRHAGSNIDFLIITMDVSTPQVASVTVQASDAQSAGWSTVQANATCSGFFPTDAVYRSQIPLTSSSGYDKIYFSASIANVFPASEFNDASQNPVKPGLFDVQFLTRPDGSIDSCDILPGTSQTQ